jgi:hypothetical protein
MSTGVDRRQSAMITTQKAAVSPPPAVRRAYRLDPREGVREIVAGLASDHNRGELIDLARALREHVCTAGELGGLQEALHRVLAESFHQSSAVPIRVTRIPSPTHNGYPLRRTYLVTVNRESDQVVAEIREIAQAIPLQGRGKDVASALGSLARAFDRLVRQHHFIPPHAREPESDRIDAILNHMVDWTRYKLENPTPQPLWGQIRRRTSRGLTVRWLIGPGGLRDTTALLPVRNVPQSLAEMSDGDWFYGTAKCYPDRVEWEEQPDAAPDPNDPEARRALWDNIPRVPADQPGCWPLTTN